MESDGAATLHVQHPAGEPVAVPYVGTHTIAEVIVAAVTAADLPRCDFQGGPLPWHLSSSAGTPFDPQHTLVAAGVEPRTVVTVDSAGAGEVIRKREQWLTEVAAQVEGTATGESVHANTLLTLVRRTSSAADRVTALQSKLGNRALPAIATSDAPRKSMVGRGAVFVVAFAAVALVWAFVFTDWIDTGSGSQSSLAAGFNVPLDRTASIDIPGQEDSYDFGATAGQRIRIELLALDGGIDPELLLYRPDGAQIARNDDNGRDGTLNSLIDIEIPTAGTYTVVARALGGEAGTGGYRVIIEDAGDADNFGENPFDNFGFVEEEAEIAQDVPPPPIDFDEIEFGPATTELVGG